LPPDAPRRRFAKASSRLVPTTAQRRIGTIVEHDLRIEALIGGGPHGVVYLATDADHQAVALKVLAAGLVERTDQPIPATRTHHPRLVEIERIGRLDDGAVFLAMPFVDGVDVASLLAEAPLSPRQALPVVRQALDVLRGAHADGMTHGDLKPENLMVSGVGLVDDKLRQLDEPVHVLDLALRSLLRPPARGDRPSSSPYRAPETIKRGRISPSADLYAMGVVLAEMLSGEPLSARVVFDPRWTEALSFLIWKAVQPEPRDRYRDATEMIAGVDTALRSLER
jgi:serine/threonine-protein kinase